MSGHSDGANTADQLRDLIRENQRLIAELRRRDEALAAVRGLAEELEGYTTRRGRPAPGSFDYGVNLAQKDAADRIRDILAAHEQAEEEGA